jgi:hypothetical protein
MNNVPMKTESSAGPPAFPNHWIFAHSAVTAARNIGQNAIERQALTINVD